MESKSHIYKGIGKLCSDICPIKMSLPVCIHRLIVEYAGMLKLGKRSMAFVINFNKNELGNHNEEACFERRWIDDPPRNKPNRDTQQNWLGENT